MTKVRTRQLGFSSGFTLTEVLIVLAILGLILGMTGSGLSGYRERSRVENEARAFAGEVLKAQLSSLASGRAQEIDKDFVRQLLEQATEPGHRTLGPPPEGLKVTVEAPLRIEPDGSCSTGRYLIDLRGTSYVVALSAPFCDATISRSNPAIR